MLRGVGCILALLLASLGFGGTDLQKSRDPLFYVLENNNVPLTPLNQKTWDEMKQFEFLFIGGQYRSGTSMLHFLLSAHSNVSDFNFRKVEAEGQHAQSVYPSAAQLQPLLNPDLNCGISAGIFPKWPESSQVFMQFKDAHLTEQSKQYISSEANARLWNSWNRHWDKTSTHRIEKSQPNLIRTRFLQAHFPSSEFLLIARHPLAAALAAVEENCTSGNPQAQLDIFQAHLQHFLLAWFWFVPQDVVHLRKVVILRFEDILLDAAGAHKALLKTLGLPSEDVAINKPIHHIQQFARKPLFFYGKHKEGIITIDKNLRAEWIESWKLFVSCMKKQGFKAQLQQLLKDFEPVLNIFGYSASPPYILSNKSMLDMFPKATWQAVMQHGDYTDIALAISGRQYSSTIRHSSLLKKLIQCRSEGAIS